MEEFNGSDRPAMQGHFYRRMQKCPRMQPTLVFHDHCNGECSIETKTCAWLLSRVTLRGECRAKCGGREERRKAAPARAGRIYM
eukprot:9429722-Pyramimonas_sp.AAC.1